MTVTLNCSVDSHEQPTLHDCVDGSGRLLLQCCTETLGWEGPPLLYRFITFFLFALAILAGVIPISGCGWCAKHKCRALPNMGNRGLHCSRLLGAGCHSWRLD